MGVGCYEQGFHQIASRPPPLTKCLLPLRSFLAQEAIDISPQLTNISTFERVMEAAICSGWLS